jgi:hypothetical protein
MSLLHKESEQSLRHLFHLQQRNLRVLSNMKSASHLAGMYQQHIEQLLWRLPLQRMNQASSWHMRWAMEIHLGIDHHRMRWLMSDPCR